MYLKKSGAFTLLNGFYFVEKLSYNFISWQCSSHMLPGWQCSSHMLPGWQCSSHMLPGWQCSATCCQDYNTQATCCQDYNTQATCCQKITDLRYETFQHPPYFHDLSPTNYRFFKFLDTFFTPKTFCFKCVAKFAFKNLLPSKPSEFYRTGINNVVNR